MTAYGGTPLTDDDLRAKRCLEEHWGGEGRRLFEMWRSHVKMATASNDYACRSSEGTCGDELLNSIPDRPGELHDLVYFLTGGLMGGFINSARSKQQENVQWRKILTRHRVDHNGDARGVSQVCVATRDIPKGEEIQYVYVYSEDDGVGRWYEGEDVSDHDQRLTRRCRTVKEYLDEIRRRREDRREEMPKKSQRGAPMSTQVVEYSSATACLYCRETMM